MPERLHASGQEVRKCKNCQAKRILMQFGLAVNPPRIKLIDIHSCVHNSNSKDNRVKLWYIC